MKFSEQTSVYIAEYLKIALEHSKKHYNESKHTTSENLENEINLENKNIKDIKEEKHVVKSEEEIESNIKQRNVQSPIYKKSTEEINLSIHDTKNMYSRHRNSIINNNLDASSGSDTNSSMKQKTLKRVQETSSSVYVSIN